MKLNNKALIKGLLTDVVGSNLFGFLLAFLLLALNNKQHLSPKESISQLVATLYSSTMLAAQLVSGAIFTALGSFVAARIAKVNELKHALVVGILSGIVGIILLVLHLNTELPTYPNWFLTLSYILLLPSAFLGGYFGKRINSRQNFDKRKLPWEAISLLTTSVFFCALNLLVIFLGWLPIYALPIAVAFGLSAVGVLMKRKWGLIAVDVAAVWYIIGGLLAITFPNIPVVPNRIIFSIVWILWWLFVIFLAYRFTKKLQASQSA